MLNPDDDPSEATKAVAHANSLTDRRTILIVAGAAGGIDPRTVARYMTTDLPVTALAVQAIRAALRALTLPDPRSGR